MNLRRSGEGTSRIVSDLSLAAERLTELGQKFGIDPKTVQEKWEQKQEKITKRVDDLAPLVLEPMADLADMGLVPDIFRIFEKRRTPSSLRAKQIDGSRGQNESKAIISLGKRCGLPSEIESPLAPEKREEYIQQVKQKLLEMQRNFNNGTLTESQLNTELDFTDHDPYNDAFLDVKAWMAKIKPEIEQSLDEAFGNQKLKDLTQGFKQSAEDWNNAPPKEKKGFWRGLIDNLW